MKFLDVIGTVCLILGTGAFLSALRSARIIKAKGRNQRIWHYYVIAGIESIIAIYGLYILAVHM